MNNKIRILAIFLFAPFMCLSQTDTIVPLSDTSTTSLVDKYSLKELLEMPIVAAKKKAQSIEEIPASVTVITDKDIEAYGFCSLTEIINHINGFYQIDDYYWMGNINFGVRGFYNVGIASNIVILVNGVSQLSDEYADYPDTKITVPIEAIKRIEVVKGPVSVLYGSGGFFGAINIITHDNKQTPTSGYFSGAAGTNSTYKIDAGMQGSADDVGFSVFASACQTDGANTTYGNLTSDNDLLAAHNKTPLSTTQSQLRTGKKFFGSIFSVKKFTFDLSYNETVKGIMDGVPSFGDGSEITHQATNFVISHHNNYSSKITTRLHAGYYQHTHNIDYEEFFRYSYRQDYKKSRAFDFEANLFYSPTQNLELDFGAYHRNVFDLFQMVSTSYYGLDAGDGEVGIPRENFMHTDAVYVQGSYNFLKYFKLSGGLRLEHLADYNLYYARGIISTNPDDNRQDPENRRVIEQTYDAPNNGVSVIPQTALIVSPNNAFTLKLLYGKAIRQPNFIDNIRQMIMNNSSFLNPQDIETYEANLLFNPGKKIFVQANFFYNKLDNLISASNIYNKETGLWQIQSSNSGEMQTLGTEGAVQINMFPVAQFKISGMYQKTNVLSAGYTEAEPGYSPNLLLYAQGAYFVNKKMSVGAKLKYTDQMYAKWDFTDLPENGYRVGSSADAFFTLDLNLGYKNLFNKGIFAKLDVKNVTNQTIRYPTTESNVWIDKGTLGTNRNFTIKVGVKF